MKPSVSQEYYKTIPVRHRDSKAYNFGAQVFQYSFRLFLSLLVLISCCRHVAHGQTSNSVGNTGDFQHPPESAQLLSSYIQIPSVTGNEGEAGLFLLEQCLKRGFHIRVFSDRKDQFNFAASLYPLDLNLPNVIFLNHIDVVPAESTEGWAYDPYSGKIEDGVIYGRGAIDMKGMAVMQLLAMEKFLMVRHLESNDFNVTLLCVSGEESINGKGASWVVENFVQELHPMVVYGEGGSGVYDMIPAMENRTLMAISVAEKQAVWLKMKWTVNTSGHGSVPPGEYANKLAVNDLRRLLRWKPKIILNDHTINTFKGLGEIEGGVKGFILKNIGLFKPLVAGVIRKNPMILSTVTNTLTLTNLGNPEGSFNQISQVASADFDCRLLPGYPLEKFLKKIQSRIHSHYSTYEVISNSMDAPGSPVNDYYFHMENSLREVYPECEVLPVLFPAVTDNNYFRKLGIPTYGINPVSLDEGMIKSIHNTNERISIENVENGIRVYTGILEKLNQREPVISRYNRKKKSF